MCPSDFTPSVSESLYRNQEGCTLSPELCEDPSYHVRKPDLYPSWNRDSFREIWDVIANLFKGQKFPKAALNIHELARRSGYCRQTVHFALNCFKKSNLLEFVEERVGAPSIYQIHWDFTLKRRQNQGGSNPLHTSPEEKPTSITNDQNPVQNWKPLAMKHLRQKANKLKIPWVTPVLGKVIWKWKVSRGKARFLHRNLHRLRSYLKDFSRLTRNNFGLVVWALRKILRRFHTEVIREQTHHRIECQESSDSSANKLLQGLAQTLDSENQEASQVENETRFENKRQEALNRLAEWEHQRKATA